LFGNKLSAQNLNNRIVWKLNHRSKLEIIDLEPTMVELGVHRMDSIKSIFFKFSIGLYHPLDGITNLKYKLLCFLTPNKKKDKGISF